MSIAKSFQCTRLDLNTKQEQRNLESILQAYEKIHEVRKDIDEQKKRIDILWACSDDIDEQLDELNMDVKYAINFVYFVIFVIYLILTLKINYTCP